MASSPTHSAFPLSAGKALLICSLLFVSSSQLLAQRDNRVVHPNYQQADLYSSTYLRQFVYDTSVRPNWIGETDQFWYSFRDSNGTHYVRVNPERGTRDPLFDRVKLSSQLSEALRKPLDPAQLSLGRAQMSDDGTELKFVSENIQFKYVFATEKLENLGAPQREAAPAGFDPNMSREEMIRRFQERQERQEQQEEQQNEQQDGEQNAENPARERQQRAAHRTFSPDRTAYVFAKGHDLYLVEVPEDVLKEALEKQAALEMEEAEKAKLKAEGKDDKDDKGDSVEEKKDGDKKESVKEEGEEQQVEKKAVEKKDAEKTEENGAAKKAAERKAARQKREADKKEGTEKKSDGTTEKDGESPAPLALQDEQEKEVKGKKQNEQEKTVTENKQDKQEKTVDEKVVEEKKQDEKQDSTKDSNKQEDSNKEVTTEKGKTSDEKKSESTDEKTDEKADKPKDLPTPDLPLEMDDTAIRLSQDGTEDYGFAGRPARAGGNRQRGGGQQGSQDESENTIKEDTKTRPSVSWSKDSQTFYTQRRDSRGVEELWVINSLATPRPTLEKYDYPMPGEENIRKSELYLCRRSAGKLNRIEPKWVDEGYSDIQYSRDETELRFLRRDRLLRNVEICSMNLVDESVNCLLTEGFENANIAPQSVRYLEESGDMIWWSERSGWGHYYLYDAAGKFKNSITSGEFLASQIVDVDESNRTMYFRGSGREPGENVYYTHLYAVQLDGSGLRLMDPGDANHSSILSKSKKYLVDNFSRVDLAPTSVLRSANGTEILNLETTDLSRLEHVGWRMPETFVVKAADGVTDLFGNMWKPFDFDPKKKYPIIAHVYPGPQTEGTQHTFSATSGNQQMAQIGFIVIQVGHRGGSPGRGKAYGSYGYMNMRDYGLADKKAAIEQLAQLHSYVDVQRVGIYGHSGGGFMTAAALMVEPYNDFFKVGVSTAGNHDNNIYNNSWSERYHGLKEVVVKEETKEGDAEAAGQRGRGGAGQRGGGRRGAGIPDYENSDYFYEYEMLNDDDQSDLDRRAGLDWDVMNAGDLPPWLFEQNPQEQDLQEKEKQEVEKKEQEKQTEGQEEGMNRRQRTGSRTRQQESGKTVTDDDKKQEKKEDVVDSDKKDSETKQEGDKEKVDDSKDGKSTEEKAREEEKEKTRFEIHVPTNAELAHNLKGHLLLVHGELDNNVHPANTLRLVDALIKANKRFDMLYLPATRHGFGQYQPYVTQRMYEFFTEHLMDDYQSGADINEKVPLK